MTNCDSSTKALAESVAKRAVDRIALLFKSFSNADYIGEPVSILQHSWQAYQVAEKCGAPREVQVASLLHDVGHMLGMEAGYSIGMDGCGIENHEAIGGDFLLSLGCHPFTAWLVSNHVNAKRFLVWKDPNYPLTEASRTTLKHQGGPMTDEEARKFMAVEGYEQSITMRSYDEAAKNPGLPEPSIDDIKQIVWVHVFETMEKGEAKLSSPERYYDITSDYRLSSEQLRFYKEYGYLVIKGHPLTTNVDLDGMATSLFANPGKEMLVHHELVQDGRVQICRVENFCSSIQKWKGITMLAEQICGELFNEPAVLFKDKLNYKMPGGGGFLAHQDATAYKPDEFASVHISVMVAVDPARSDDVGPLQFAKGRHEEGIFPHTKGVIEKTVEDSLVFEPLYAERGDIVFFSSYIPHRSFHNTSKNSRRLAYLTFNKEREGNFHDAYYKAKLESFKDGTGGTISINDDFGGTIVTSP
jgi:predicted HD phosphohydrolase